MACIYGDVMRIPTTGASEQTGRQDGQPLQGERASHALAATDLSRMNKYKSTITKVARDHQMDPAVIAGIISRESRAGNALDKGGCGDHGNAHGLMQVDKRWHTPRGGPYSEEHISQGTKILCDSVKEIQRKFPNWSKEQQLKGGLSAYNMGASRVPSYEQTDINTTGGDYANDVLARAQWYKQNGF
ncbi:lysozyme g-like [Chanos chanos]|uniref:Lysozyme g n=1 Tax=Chanos chanos TaxID=29144 RepID=A0A6J2UW78_CHACN|nr:lysozyme g-like [Chanos chanos]